MKLRHYLGLAALFLAVAAAQVAPAYMTHLKSKEAQKELTYFADQKMTKLEEFTSHKIAELESIMPSHQRGIGILNVAKGVLIKGQGLDSILNDPEGKALFVDDGLPEVDLSDKHVRVDVPRDLVSAIGEEQMMHSLEHTRQFYSQHGINIDFQMLDRVDYGTLNETNHLAFRKVSSESMQDDATSTTLAAALMEQGTIVVPEDLNERLEGNKSILGEIWIHELGHMFGIYHPDMFLDYTLPGYNSLTPFYEPIANCMLQGKAEECHLDDQQVREMHSFLSEGRIYLAHAAVDFDAINYVLLVGEANGLYFNDITDQDQFEESMQELDLMQEWLDAAEEKPYIQQ